MQFANDGRVLVRGTRCNKVYEYVKCKKCKQYGHYSNRCPNVNNDSQANVTDDDDVQMLMDATEIEDVACDFIFAQLHDLSADEGDVSMADIDVDWALLIDTGSTCSVVMNESLLEDVHESNTVLRAYTNGGHQDSRFMGNLPGFFPVWFNPDSLLNILSFSDVCAHFRVTVDTANEDAIMVHLRHGILKFICMENGLYMADCSVIKPKSTVAAYSFAMTTTVSQLKSEFTRREIQGADKARELYKCLGMPSYQKLISSIQSNAIRNCPVTVADVRRALYLYGPDVAALKGKTPRSKPTHIPSVSVVPIPTSILASHPTITICMDFFFVQGLTFLHSISRGYQFRTVQSTPNRSKKTILDGFKNIQRLTDPRGARITELRGDQEFSCITDDIRPVFANLAAPGEHVPEIERSVRTIKERTRATLHDLPYRWYPKIMIEGCVYSAVKLLNSLPSDNGVSKTMSPATLMTGCPPLDYEILTKIRFGMYAQVNVEHLITNDNKARTYGGIALYPTGNVQGAWFFMNLNTGKRFQGRTWTTLPIPDAVIERVHSIAKAQGQSEVKNDNFLYEWEPKSTIEDVDGETEDYTAIIGDMHRMSDDVDDEIPELVKREDDDVEPTVGELQNPDAIDENVHDDVDDVDVDILANDNVADMNATGPTNNDPTATPSEVPNMDAQDSKVNVTATDEGVEIDEVQGADDQTDKAEEAEDFKGDIIINSKVNDEVPSSKTPSPIKRYNLRERKKKVNFKNLHHGWQYLQLAKAPSHKRVTSPKKVNRRKRKAEKKLKDIYRRAVHICMNQMSAKKGIERHGQAAINAILKEYKQLHDLDVFRGIHRRDLTPEQHKRVLRLITVIKEKRCGKLKGRACADGRSQRSYIPKEDTTSPTVALESLLTTLAIDAKEKRDVATADVAGAFLHGIMEDFVVIKLVGDEVDIMCNVDGKYRQYVVYEHGKKTIYLQLHKALYGTLLAAIIWYKTFKGCLEGLGFKLNPYDPCVANLMVDGKQLTIVWFVDDTKISHVDPKTVDWLLEKIEEEYGKLSITRGNKHTFVGIDFEIMSDGKVKIITKDYITEAIEDFGEDVSAGAVTPAANNLFVVSDEGNKLGKEQHDTFHSIVAKLLFVSKRSRLDIGLAVAFLCTRVSKSTHGDWNKLKRLLKYLYSTIDMPRIYSFDNLVVIKTWVDASYAIHPDMKSHTGGVISLGHGVLTSKSSKQKLNVKSSTEAEVVGASDYIPYTVWLTRFLESQGYEASTNIFFQDNQSAIRLEKNGRQSCGEKSRHINIRYFFIKDVIKREHINIEYCPTEEMIADFYTKPLQGAQFRRLRNFIMGVTDSVSTPPSEERVENAPNVDALTSSSSHKSGTLIGAPGSVIDGTTGAVENTKGLTSSCAQSSSKEQVDKKDRSCAEAVKGV